jgi:hypothetical protein
MRSETSVFYRKYERELGQFDAFFRYYAPPAGLLCWDQKKETLSVRTRSGCWHILFATLLLAIPLHP